MAGFSGAVEDAVDDRRRSRRLTRLFGRGGWDDQPCAIHIHPREPGVCDVDATGRIEGDAIRFEERVFRRARDFADPFAGFVELVDQVPFFRRDEQVVTHRIDGYGGNVAFFFFLAEERAIGRSRPVHLSFEGAGSRVLVNDSKKAVGDIDATRRGVERDAVRFVHFAFREHADERAFRSFFGARGLRFEDVDRPDRQLRIFGVNDVDVAIGRATRIVDRNAGHFAEVFARKRLTAPFADQFVACPVRLVDKDFVRGGVRYIDEAGRFVDRQTRRVEVFAELRDGFPRRVVDVDYPSFHVRYEHPAGRAIDRDRQRFDKRRAEGFRQVGLERVTDRARRLLGEDSGNRKHQQACGTQSQADASTDRRQRTGAASCFSCRRLAHPMPLIGSFLVVGWGRGKPRPHTNNVMPRSAAQISL